MSRSAAVISSLVAEVAINAGRLRRLEPLALPRNYYALVSKTAPPTRALSVLLDDIRANVSATSIVAHSLQCESDRPYRLVNPEFEIDRGSNLLPKSPRSNF
jgi:hypothetical protein